MRALQIVSRSTVPVLTEVSDPVAGPGQVVVKVGGAGACHSDLHLLHSDTLPFVKPFTLGHEVAGWVHEVGPGVTAVQPGQPVAVYGAWGCGSCTRCTAGLDNYCDGPVRPMQGGLGLDGGMADKVLVPDARYLIPLPDGLSPVQAAPLTDAGLTPYHAVARSLHKLGPASTAVVIGVGGLGHLAVQVLKTTTAAQVVAVDNRPEALEHALALGADLAVTGDDASHAVRTATRRQGADVVLDFVGTDATLATSVACSRSLGDVTVVGVAGGSVPFGFMNAPFEVSFQSTYWGSRAELGEVLALAARGLLTAQVTTYALERAVEAYRALEAGELVGRAVVVPHDGP